MDRKLSLISFACLVVLSGLSLPAFGQTAPNPDNASGPLIVYANDWKPMSQGDNGAVQGLLPSLMHEIVAKRMGHPIRKHGVPWRRAQVMVRNGQADGFVTAPTKKRLEYAVRARNNVYALQFRAFTLKHGLATRLFLTDRALKSDTPLRFCDVLGNGWAQRFYRQRRLSYLKAPTVENCLRMIAGGRADALVHSTAVTRAKLSSLDLSQRFQMHKKIYPGAEFTLLLSRKSRYRGEFLQKFDRTVDRMKADGSYDALVRRLLGLS